MQDHQHKLYSSEKCRDLTDAQIIERAKQNLDYFSCLFERYEAKLSTYVGRISNFSETEIQDILQESFIKIWRNLNLYKPSIKLSSWIYRIVHNETISYWRKQKANKSNFSYSDELQKQAAPSENDAHSDEEKTRQRIRVLLDGLPVKYREVIILKFIENMSYEEISDILRIPEGTVATRINRAKKMIIRNDQHNHLKNRKK